MFNDEARDVVTRFAEWCAIHADVEPDDEYYADYLNNFEVVGDHTIIVRLGAFDHGAGVATLIVNGTQQLVDYEDTVIEFARGQVLRNLP